MTAGTMTNHGHGHDHLPRRGDRRNVEILARLRHDLSNITVVLKDLSEHGARVEAIAGLKEDQPVALTLPGCKPLLAFVAWSSGHCAGLEFADPLPGEVFATIIAEYGVRAGPPVQAPLPIQSAA